MTWRWRVITALVGWLVRRLDPHYEVVMFRADIAELLRDVDALVAKYEGPCGTR